MLSSDNMSKHVKIHLLSWKNAARMLLLLVLNKKGKRECYCYLCWTRRAKGNATATCVEQEGQKGMLLLLVLNKKGKRECFKTKWKATQKFDRTSWRPRQITINLFTNVALRLRNVCCSDTCTGIIISSPHWTSLSPCCIPSCACPAQQLHHRPTIWCNQLWQKHPWTATTGAPRLLLHPFL